MYLFAYGSLCGPDAASAMLGRDVVPRPAWAHGWERGWYVAIDNRASGSYACERCGGLPATCLVLGIRPAPGSRVLGALIDITPDDVAAIARRERSYRMDEITAHDVAGGTVSALAAVPLRERVAPDGAKAAVAGAYEDSVRAALQGLAEAAGIGVAGARIAAPAWRRDDLRYVRGDGMMRAACRCAAP
jgi:hypothetical protein